MRMRWLARLLLPRLQAWTEGLDPRTGEPRKPDFEVVRGDDRQVYLRRWWVIPRNNRFNVYLHNMLLSDDPILHDHMYWSLSLVLTDGIRERWVEEPKKIREQAGRYLDEHEVLSYRMEALANIREFRAGDLVLRSANMAHQLIIGEGKNAWTLFITGPRIKDWGFWCPRGKRHWEDYVARGQDPSKQGNGAATTSGKGVGCGEMG